MRFAIFSDIHANLQAWEAVLADIQSQGADTLVCLGDVVGYGPMPGPVLESVYQYTDNFVLGNHDAVVGGRIDAGTFNEHARYVIRWTAEQLGDEGAAFFAQVPLTLRGEKMLFTHGDAARPGHFDYVVKAEDARPSFQSCKDEVIFFGHTHDPCVFACANNRGIIDKLPGADVVLRKGRRYMINPGSVGDPRSASDLRASYCLYDDTTRRLTFRKVKFDAEAYRADLQASGLEMLPYFLRVIDAGSRRPEEEEELALVQDHRGEVEVDETMTAQPRALVTVGSPMANRPKLHFGYAPLTQQPYQAPPGYYQPHPMPHTRPIHQLPIPPRKRNRAAILIVGVLLGAIGLLFALSHFSKPSKSEIGDLGDGERKKEPKLLANEDGWENAAEPEPGPAVEVSPERKPPAVIRELPARAPIFSLHGNLAKKVADGSATLPDGVKIVKTGFLGDGLSFGAGVREGVTVPFTGDVHEGGSITIVAWIRVSKESNDRFIYMQDGGTMGTIYMMVTRDGTSDTDQNIKPGCVLFGGTGVNPAEIRSSYSGGKKRIDDGEWHQVVAMHDKKEGLMRIYIDGRISTPKKCKGTFPRIQGPIVIGKGDFSGEISGVRVYDWPMHTDDVAALYEAERKKSD